MRPSRFWTACGAFSTLSVLCVMLCAQDGAAESLGIKPTVAESPDLAIKADANGESAATTEDVRPERNAKFRTELVAGRVTWLSDALKSVYGISTVPEVSEHQLVIMTDREPVIPLVENLRGRAFRKDERLRNVQVELLLRRYENQPFAQILKVFQSEAGKRYEVDYWCDVCAIVMYETGPCACCQDHNRLRKRLVEGVDQGAENDL